MGVILTSAHLVAFVASRGLETADRYYGGVLGFERVESSEFANAYDANGPQLRVTCVDEFSPALDTVLGWRVRDIVTEIEVLRTAGVIFKRYEGMSQDERGVWTSPSGAPIAWFADPDGNTLSLQEASADGPCRSGSGTSVTS